MNFVGVRPQRIRLLEKCIRQTEVCIVPGDNDKWWIMGGNEQTWELTKELERLILERRGQYENYKFGQDELEEIHAPPELQGVAHCLDDEAMPVFGVGEASLTPALAHLILEEYRARIYHSTLPAKDCRLDAASVKELSDFIASLTKGNPKKRRRLPFFVEYETFKKSKKQPGVDPCAGGGRVA